MDNDFIDLWQSKGPLIRPADAAKLLQCKQPYINELIQKGRLNKIEAKYLSYQEVYNLGKEIEKNNI